MGWIVVVDNPMQPDDAEIFEHSGSLIDWLVAHYPAGFPCGHCVSVNMSRLPVADYDREIGPDDTAVIILVPMGPLAGVGIGSLIAKAVIGAVISTALNFVASALFGPSGSKPKAPSSVGSTPAAESVYNINTPTNQAKIGNVIPVGYGRNLMVPDLASAGYRWYQDNDEWVGFILCLGQGSYEIEKILFGDTDEQDLQDGVTTVTQIWPSQHNQTFGYVQANTGVFENMYTSAEVTDLQILPADVDDEGAPVGAVRLVDVQMWNGLWSYSRSPSCTFFPQGPSEFSYQGGLVYFGGDNDLLFDFLDRYKDSSGGRRTVYAKVTDAGDNDGYYTVHDFDSWKVITCDDAGVPELDCPDSGCVDNPQYGRKFTLGYEEDGETPVEWSRDGETVTGTIELRYTPFPDDPGGGEAPAYPPNVMGPYVVVPRGARTTKLSYDIEFPQGLYVLDQESGNLDNRSVPFRAYAIEIDDDDVELGPVHTHDLTLTAGTNTPRRYTTAQDVPEGRYKVGMLRLDAESDNAYDQSTAYWTGLKAALGNTYGGPVYGNVTLLGVRIKASEGLSSSAHNRVSVIATRKLDGVAERHPIPAFRDIYTNFIYGGRRPLSELDNGRLDELAAIWEGATFDAVLDTQVPLWEALQLILQGQHAAPVADASTVTIVEDSPYAVSQYSFCAANIKDLTITYLFANQTDHDGVEVEWRHPDDGTAEYVYWPVEAVDPEPVRLWGCTDEDAALAYAKRRWNQLVYRRELVAIEVEAAGNIIQVGDVLSIEHYLLEPNRCYVVTAVNAADEYTTTIETYVFRPEVYL